MKCLQFSHMTPISFNGRKASSWRKRIIPECINNSQPVTTERPSLQHTSAVSLGAGLVQVRPCLGWVRIEPSGSLGSSALRRSRCGQGGIRHACWETPCIADSQCFLFLISSAYLCDPRASPLVTSLFWKIPNIFMHGLTMKDCLWPLSAWVGGRFGHGSRCVFLSPFPTPVKILYPAESGWSGQGISASEKEKEKV